MEIRDGRRSPYTRCVNESSQMGDATMIHVKQQGAAAPARSRVHGIEEGGVALGGFPQLAHEELDGVHRAHGVEDAA